MDHLHQILASKVREWRDTSYPCDEFPAITEILEYQVQSEEVSDGGLVDTLRFLREPQRRALETYWYLRLIENTPHIPDLYAGMVDSVMIDPDYDGEALDVALYDVPESKNDLVKGSYVLPAPDSGGAISVAVKITDMLGEEVLTTKEIGSATG